MKLLRVELHNYRGVDARSIEFSPDGITIVEGANEIGKSSIAEAVDRALEELDSTAKKSVVATRPVGRDVGPEVSLEIETGPYAFHYRKRFLRQPLTELHIRRPRAEDLTGREAHDRVRSILAETVDLGLWKALRIQQGSAVDQPSLRDQSSLSAALDRAAGEVPAGEEEQSLFDYAHSEYLGYWTETGRRKRESTDLDQGIDEANRKLTAVQTALRQIEGDVDSSARLQAEIRRLIERLQTQREGAEQLTADVDHLTQQEAEVESIEARCGAARVAAAAAHQNSDARRHAVVDLASAAAERKRLAGKSELASGPIKSAKERLTIADAAVAATRAARDLARDTARTRRADLSFRRDERDLVQLVRRKTQVDAALASLQSATAVLATNKADAASLGAINDLTRAVELARGRLGAHQPLVEIDALGNVHGVLNGDSFRLAAGERVERRVEESLKLSIPGVLKLKVTTEVGDDPILVRLRSDEANLADLCRRIGSVDAADAEHLHRERLAAETVSAEQRRILAENLQQLTPEAIEGDLIGLRTRVDQFVSERGQTPPIPLDEATARAASDEADEILAAAEQALAAAEHEAESARARLNELRVAEGELGVELRLATEKAGQLKASLESSRSDTADAVLAKRSREATRAEATLAEQLRLARVELEGEVPEQARAKLDNATQAVATSAKELRAAEDELIQVQTRLRDRGEDGLAEELDTATAALTSAERERDQYKSRAAARRLLFETLRDERESARRSYVAPLQQRIEHLGRFVFGSDFTVQLDDELRIVNRTLRDRTIPYESLSVGAQEQLGLISRLACATIVAPDGGVPIILDDALGNSDPQRLEAMGAVLSVAGRQSQIIILTCQPDRYQQVGGATVVRMT